MANELHNPRYRYVDASNLENANVDLDDLDVRNAAGDKLGDVDGFIVDSVSARPYYVVVSSGGWFSSRQYIVPVNHTRLEHDASRNEDLLRVNLDKETIRNYPRFDQDEFAALSDAELRDFENRLGTSCCPQDASRNNASGWNYENWQHYRQPDWWRARERAVGRTRAVEPHVVGTDRATTSLAGKQVVHDPERIVARDSVVTGDRAQPGDVLGIESGGEETHVGDTVEDERRRTVAADRETRNAEKNNRG